MEMKKQHFFPVERPTSIPTNREPEGLGYAFSTQHAGRYTVDCQLKTKHPLTAATGLCRSGDQIRVESK
jgi:hypothetical protein